MPNKIEKDLVGTTSTKFKINETSADGITLKSDSAGLHVRNKADTDYENIKALDPITADDVLTKRKFYTVIPLLIGSNNITTISGSYISVGVALVVKNKLPSSLVVLAHVQAFLTLAGTGEYQIVATQGGTTTVLGGGTFTNTSLAWLTDSNISTNFNALTTGTWQLDLQVKRNSGIGTLTVGRVQLTLTGE